MNLYENMIGALESLRSHKMRSFLTIIGIVVGIAAVVTIVSIGQAGKSTILSDLSKYGNETFFVYPNPSIGRGSYDNSMTMGDLEQLRRLPGVAMAAGTTNMSLGAKLGKEDVRFNITGTNAEFAKLESLKLEKGRFFTTSEERGRQQVLVVESDYTEKQFGPGVNPVDRRITVGGRPYRIIGVVKSEKAMFSGPDKTTFTAYAPVSALPISTEGSSVRLGILYIKAKNGEPEQLQETIHSVKKLLSKRHNAPDKAYASQTFEETQQQVKQTFNVLQTIIGSIAGISLLVGGIGVMNIMLVSVTERTREIGIRKAVGATPGKILQQFVMEAVFLCLIGGLLGTLIGLFGAYLFSFFTKWPFIISWETILLAFGFSAAVGLFFGLYPAGKAARLHPIDSLRYE